MTSDFEYSDRIQHHLASLSRRAKAAQLDLALTTTIPRFIGVSDERFLEVHERKGTPPEVLQIISNLEAYLVLDQEGEFSEEIARKMLLEDGFGSIWGLVQGGNPAQNQAASRHLQQLSVHESPSKLPLLIIEEGLHGLLAPGSTVFPQAIAVGAVFSPAMAEEIALAIGQEAAARGVNALFAPVLDLALDARWGRCEETFGSDPRLVSDLGAAFVRGFRKAGVAPIVKHFCGHGWVCGGRDSNDNALSMRELRRLHLPPFQAAIEAGALGVMSAYHAVNGIPCTANHTLLTAILRNELSFRGLIISDAGSVEDLDRKYHVAPDLQSSIKLAFQAGLNVHNNGPDFKEHILELVEQGELSEKTLDDSVSRVLYVKDQIGLLEETPSQDDFDDQAWMELKSGNEQLALQAARSCLTLLKNENQLLPLDASRIGKIAVIGCLAEDSAVMLGDYSQANVRASSLLEELVRLSPPGCRVDYLEELHTERDIKQGTDLLILPVGESSAFGEKALSGEGCDRAVIELPEDQRMQIRIAAKTGLPILLLIFGGRPLALEEEARLADSMLYCYFPGQFGARAVAEIIFGIHQPLGNLPYDLPRKTGQTPIFYHQLPSGRSRDYCDLESSALFPFGHGLRYSAFSLSDLEIEVVNRAPDPDVELSLSVQNTGRRGSEALVQVYCQDLISSVLAPEKRLVAYQKIWIDPGGSAVIDFRLGFSAFALLDKEEQWRVEPGDFEISVGFSCQDISLKQRMEI